MNDEAVMSRAECEKEEIRLPAYEKLVYKPIFYNPNGALTGFVDDYYSAAWAIVRRIAEGKAFGDTEGIAALFLFRHYLELALKDIVFGLRHLQTRRKNVSRSESVQPAFGHKLGDLWGEIKKCYPRKMGQKQWNALDAEFLDQCVCEFEKIDPSGQRFRYSIEKKSPARDRLNPLAVSWETLPYIMEHARDVIVMMDTYLVETYAENEEWEVEMNAW